MELFGNLKKEYFKVRNKVLKIVTPFRPNVGSEYEFVQLFVQVNNATNRTKALVIGVNEIVLDCTLYIVKDLVLCAKDIISSWVTCVRGDSNFAVGAF